MSPGLIPENNKAAEPSAASSEWTEPAGTRDAWSLLAGCGLSRLFIRGVVGPALPGFVLCSLYSQLTTCHGNWNLSQVLGKLELLNQTVIIEFHAHRNYDKWRRPVLVFCLCRARMSLELARPLTWDGIYTHLPPWPPITYRNTLCLRKMLPEINATSSSEKELCRHNIVLEARRPQVLGTICYGLYVTFMLSIWKIMDHAPNSFRITYGSVRTLAIIAS